MGYEWFAFSVYMYELYSIFIHLYSCSLIDFFGLVHNSSYPKHSNTLLIYLMAYIGGVCGGNTNVRTLFYLNNHLHLQFIPKQLNKCLCM